MEERKKEMETREGKEVKRMKMGNGGKILKKENEDKEKTKIDQTLRLRKKKKRRL